MALKGATRRTARPPGRGSRWWYSDPLFGLGSDRGAFHEGAHVSLDYDYDRSPGWISAQEEDGLFISDYAEENPERMSLNRRSRGGQFGTNACQDTTAFLSRRQFRRGWTALIGSGERRSK